MGDFGKAPAISAILANGAIQYICEMVVDFVVVAYLTVFANQPYLSYAHLHHNYYLLTMSMVCLYSSAFITVNVTPYLMHRIAPLPPNATCASEQCGHASVW